MAAPHPQDHLENGIGSGKLEKNERGEDVKAAGQNTVVARAPGRANIIGEHVDYNDGFILPFAIDRYTSVRIQPSEDGFFHLSSTGYGEESFSPGILQHQGDWQDYVKAVVNVLQQQLQSDLPPLRIHVSSDVPAGAGLSSSAAIEVATMMACKEFFGLNLSAEQVYLWCQKAENEFVGVRCGIMDQFISVMARKNHAVFLDTMNMEYEYVPIQAKFLVVNTGVSHALGSGEYNVRRNQCEEALAVLGKTSFRQLTLSMLQEQRDKLETTIFRRARHVISENARVLQCKQALQENNLILAGELMTRTHQSLKEDYETSCEEADFLVDHLLQNPAIAGARIMGGGFGGSVIALVLQEIPPIFLQELSRKYSDRFQVEPQFYPVEPSEGATVARE